MSSGEQETLAGLIQWLGTWFQDAGSLDLGEGLQGIPGVELTRQRR